ncbi:MAG: SsrA-binding protein SmpB [Marinilabiliales bacterium]|nr:MAG: SsrA-binding protein SmpB [Marinilabiliales bacterium]
MSKQKSNISIKNRKASFNFELVEKFVAGIVLGGTEIKSIREGKANLADAYCFFISDELWVSGMNIAEYSHGSYNNHDPGQDRKLLLNKRELRKLKKKSQDKGFTIVATRLFINERGLAKLEIALARGKREYDKRQEIKKRDINREMDRLVR